MCWPVQSSLLSFPNYWLRHANIGGSPRAERIENFFKSHVWDFIHPKKCEILSGEIYSVKLLQGFDHMDYYGGERSVKTSSVANPLFEVAHSRVADFRQGRGTALYADADFQYLRNLVAFGFPQYGHLQNTDTSRNTSVVTRTRWLLDNCLIIAATGQFKPPSPSSSPPSSSPPWSPRSPSPKVFQLGI